MDLAPGKLGAATAAPVSHRGRHAVPPEVVGGARTVPVRSGKNISSARTRTNGAA